LEAKLAATRSEMDERIASNEKKTKEYNDELDAAHKKYRIVVAVNDTKVADLNKTHVEATESLRRTSKEAEIECERLRTQIGSARDQVEEKVAENEKLVEAHTIAKAESLQKYKDVVKDHEKRIADMINKHEDQTDDLRRQLLSANLECDKIRAELASLQMLAAPHDADAIVSRTMRSASFKMPQKSATKRIIPVLQISSAVMVVVIAIAYQLGLLSMNAMCAPVMPGSTLADDASALFGAPWWVPANFKEQAFGAICGDRPRASLKFSSGRLVVADEATAKMLLDKRSEIVAVQGNVINFFDRKGKIDSLRSPWAI
jgi:small-conductance mechanosensitive channel